MPTVPDNEVRLRLRVALKLMTWLAVAAAVAVTLAYFGGGAGPPGLPEPRRVDLSGLETGRARTILWGDRPVVVLRLGEPGSGERWLVAFASDPATGCPVRWAGAQREFRSSCGDARYDDRGQPLAGSGKALAVPPHRFAGDAILILGGRSGRSG